MKPLELNLARRPYRNDLPIAVLLSMLFIATLAFTGNNLYTWVTADARLEMLKSEMVDHEARMAAMEQEAKTLNSELEAIDMDVLTPQAEFVESVLQQRNFSWTMLFNALEEVLPWNVKLMTIRPRFEAGRVLIRVTGMSRGYDGYVNFQDALQQSPYFDQVVPSGYETGEGSESRLTFGLDFEYKVDKHFEALQNEDAGRMAEDGTQEPELRIVEGEETLAQERAGMAQPGSTASKSGLEGPDLPRSQRALADETAAEAPRAGRRSRRGGKRPPRRDAASAASSRRKAPHGKRPAKAKAESGFGDAGVSALLPRGGSTTPPPVDTDPRVTRRPLRAEERKRPTAPATARRKVPAPVKPGGSSGPAPTEDVKRPPGGPDAPNKPEIDYSHGLPQIVPAVDPNAPSLGDPRQWKPGKGKDVGGEKGGTAGDGSGGGEGSSGQGGGGSGGNGNGSSGSGGRS